MFVFMIVLVILVIGLTVLVFRQRSSYTYMFVSKLVLIDFFLFLTTLFVRKIETFQPVFSWEMSIYFFLAKIKISYSLLFDLFTYGITAYLLISLIMAFSMLSFKRNLTMIVYMFCAAVPLLLFMYLNLYDSGVAIHLTLAGEGENAIVAFAGKWLNIYNALIIAVYTFLPFGVLLFTFIRTRIRYKRRYVVVMGICMLTVEALAILTLWIAPYRSLLFYAPNFLRTPNGLAMHINQNYVVMVVVGMLLIGVFTYFAAIRKVFDNIDLNFATVKKPAKNSKIYFKDMRPLCHTYKNILMSVDLMAKTMLQKNPGEAIQEDIKEMRGVIGDALTRMARILDIYNEPNEVIETTDLVECIQNSVERAGVPGTVSVTVTAPERMVLINADGILLEEVFINLFQNSCEAIWKKGNNDGKIDIEIRTEGNWSCTYFRDNGCGIPKKDYANVFKPLYSTKKTSENWGVGLSFVANVIMSVGGKILVKSKENVFTEFEILLPANRRRKGRRRKSGDRRFSEKGRMETANMVQ